MTYPVYVEHFTYFVKITELGFEVEGLIKFLFTPDMEISYLIFNEDTGVEILYIVYNIYIPFAWQRLMWRKSKDWVASNQDNVSDLGDNNHSLTRFHEKEKIWTF
jgi:hypothetical protein